MPDGKNIAYRGVDPWVAAVPAEGGESTEIEIASDPQIVPSIPGGGMHVSPDGRRILFSGYERGVRPLGVDIWTIPVEGGPATRITDSPTQDRYPCWSPDGESIAFLRYRFVSEREVVHNLYLVPSAGGEPRAITADADSVTYAAFAFSPDGDRLAFFSNGTIKIRPAEGGEARVVGRPETVHSHSELAWSPDGQKIAYTGRGSIWITSVDGGEPMEVRTGVLSEEAQNLHIDWSPDGERIVFSASTGGDAELWLISDFLK
jgi:Tol biopolymer transport system component